MSNPDALKSHEGQEVKVKAQEDAAKNEIHMKMKARKRKRFEQRACDGRHSPATIIK
jgi:hypothetical protein